MVMTTDEKGPEQAPQNSLPTWAECQLRVRNADSIAAQIARGGHDATELETDKASQLHRFIYEYDDADPYRSAWFLHRLELVLNERADLYEQVKRERDGLALKFGQMGYECKKALDERDRYRAAIDDARVKFSEGYPNAAWIALTEACCPPTTPSDTGSEGG